MVRSEGHEMIVDDYIIPPAEVRVKVAFFLREARHKIVADLREMALRHPEQRAWTETLALRYERWEEET